MIVDDAKQQEKRFLHMSIKTDHIFYFRVKSALTPLAKIVTLMSQAIVYRCSRLSKFGKL